jgi:hypothetical protein
MHESKARSPYETFTQVPILPDIQNAHPFGCPVYVLNKRLQQGQKISKWDARSNLGVYLGTSALHASSVGLVLSLRTGLVSSSFYNAYDDKFVTVSSSFGKYIPKSQWQIKCGFHEDPNLMNLTMQPISNQQLTALDTLQLNDINPNINNNVHHDANSENTNNHDKYGTEGGTDHKFDVQPIEAVYEGNDIIEQSNETTKNSVTSTEESNTQIPPKQTVTRSGRVSRRPRKYDDYVSYPTWMENVSLQATSDPDTQYYHQVLREPDQQMLQWNTKLSNIMIITIGYQLNDHRYHQHRVFYQVFAL